MEQRFNPSYQIYLTPDLAQAIEGAVKIAKTLNDEFISTEHLFISIIEIPGPSQDLLTKFRIDKESVLNVLE